MPSAANVTFKEGDKTGTNNLEIQNSLPKKLLSMNNQDKDVEEEPNVEAIKESPKVEVIEESPKVETIKECPKVEVVEESPKVEVVEESINIAKQKVEEQKTPHLPHSEVETPELDHQEIPQPPLQNPTQTNPKEPKSSIEEEPENTQHKKPSEVNQEISVKDTEGCKNGEVDQILNNIEPLPLAGIAVI